MKSLEDMMKTGLSPLYTIFPILLRWGFGK